MIDWFWAIIEAIRYYPTLVVRGWWKHPPFLPLISKRYIKFRLDTNYGMVEHGHVRPHWRVLVKDARSFLLWRRKFRIMGKLYKR